MGGHHSTVLGLAAPTFTNMIALFPNDSGWDYSKLDSLIALLATGLIFGALPKHQPHKLCVIIALCRVASKE
jgi:hypothetical protein